MDFEQVKKEVTDFSKKRDWDQFHTPENLKEELGDLHLQVVLQAQITKEDGYERFSIIVVGCK